MASFFLVLPLQQRNRLQKIYGNDKLAPTKTPSLLTCVLYCSLL
jgi:hypothetical protein